MWDQIPAIPEILRIEPVLEAVRKVEGIGVYERGPYTIVNYAVVFDSTFPPVTDISSAILRECRGLVFKNGILISRPLHKFFNLSERPETSIDVVRELVQYRHTVKLKVDGSMIHTFVDPDTNQIVYNTRMGQTDVAAMAALYVSSLRGTDDAILADQYERLIRVCSEEGFTPIFEYCGYDNQVVIQHEKQHMILLAVRHIQKGYYLCDDGIAQLLIRAQATSVPLVPTLSHNVGDIGAFSQQMYQNDTGIEGAIIDWGMFKVKIKTDWYTALHRTIDSISRLTDIVPMILDNRIDDLIARLPEYKRVKVEALTDQVNRAVVNTTNKLRAKMLSIHQNSATRKDFALAVQADPEITAVQRPLMFAYMYGTAQDVGSSIRELVVRALISKATMSGVKYRQYCEQMLEVDLDYE